MGAKRLEESSYCPQRTRQVSRGGQRGGEESCGPGCCGRSKGSGAEDGSLDLTPKKVTDFRAHTQYNVCAGGGWRGRQGEPRLELEVEEWEVCSECRLI